MTEHDYLHILKHSAKDPSIVKNLLKYDVIIRDSSIIEQTFKEAYDSGIDCTNFQQEISNLYKENGREAPNFFQDITKNWMSNLPTEAKNQLFNKILLPGTHDTAAKEILWEKYPIIFTGWKEILYWVLQIPGVKSFIENWTITQTKTITDQLKDGIRLFDLRLAKDSNNDLYMGHTFLVSDFQKTIQEIKKFAEEHPQEIIVANIKVDPFYQKFMTKEDIAKAVNIVTKELDDFILPNNISLKDQTLGELQKQKKNIIFYSSFGELNKDNNFLREDKNHEVWPNVTQTNKIVATIKEKSKNLPSREFVYASLNTTPNLTQMVTELLSGNSSVSFGEKSQKELDKLLTTLNELETTMQGVILDDPGRVAIQKLVNNARQLGIGEVIKTPPITQRAGSFVEKLESTQTNSFVEKVRSTPNNISRSM